MFVILACYVLLVGAQVQQIEIPHYFFLLACHIRIFDQRIMSNWGIRRAVLQLCKSSSHPAVASYFSSRFSVAQDYNGKRVSLYVDFARMQDLTKHLDSICICRNFFCSFITCVSLCTLES